MAVLGKVEALIATQEEEIDQDSAYGLHLLAEVAAAMRDQDSSFLDKFLQGSDDKSDKNGSLCAWATCRVPKKRRSVRRRRKRLMMGYREKQGVCAPVQTQAEMGLKRRSSEIQRGLRIAEEEEEEEEEGLKLKRRKLVLCHGGFRFNLNGPVLKGCIHGSSSQYGSGGSGLMAC